MCAPGQRFAGFPVNNESVQRPPACDSFAVVGRRSAHHDVLPAAHALRFERCRSEDAHKGFFDRRSFVRTGRAPVQDQRFRKHDIDARLIAHVSAAHPAAALLRPRCEWFAQPPGDDKSRERNMTDSQRTPQDTDLPPDTPLSTKQRGISQTRAGRQRKRYIYRSPG